MTDNQEAVLAEALHLEDDDVEAQDCALDGDVPGAGAWPFAVHETKCEPYHRLLAKTLLAAMPDYTLVRKDTLDNPEYDGTDAAHPAWWRGSDHATKVLTAEIERLRAALENLVAEAKSPKVVPTLELLAALQDATRALRPAAHRRQQ